jgi:hypothetical protein
MEAPERGQVKAIVCNPPPAATISDSDSLTLEGTLIAQTVPEQTQDGGVVICSAWWMPALDSLVRVYPMPFTGGRRAWRRYRLELRRDNRKDSRWRSFELADGGPIECIDRRPQRDSLRCQLERLARGTTIDRLNERRDSMGVIRPVGEVALHIEHATPDASREFGRKTFGARPKLRFDDADGHHDLSLNEWGCYEFIRKGGDPEKLNLRLDDPAREQLLLVGNYRNHPNSWCVVSVVGYAAVRPRLFV